MGRVLSGLQTLPDAFTEDLQWLFDMIASERMTQLAMLEEFNRRLAAKGGKPASQSALNRYVIKVRDGDARRPGGPPVTSGTHAITETGAVFTTEFRMQLVGSIGESAVRAQEALLSALSNLSS